MEDSASLRPSSQVGDITVSDWGSSPSDNTSDVVSVSPLEQAYVQPDDETEKNFAAFTENGSDFSAWQTPKDLSPENDEKRLPFEISEHDIEHQEEEWEPELPPTNTLWGHDVINPQSPFSDNFASPAILQNIARAAVPYRHLWNTPPKRLLPKKKIIEEKSYTTPKNPSIEKVTDGAQSTRTISTGIYECRMRDRMYIRAMWTDPITRTRYQKYFKLWELGREKAIEMAKEARKRGIEMCSEGKPGPSTSQSFAKKFPNHTFKPNMYLSSVERAFATESDDVYKYVSQPEASNDPNRVLQARMYHVIMCTRKYWRVEWQTVAGGKRAYKHFGENKYGVEESREAAYKFFKSLQAEGNNFLYLYNKQKDGSIDIEKNRKRVKKTLDLLPIKIKTAERFRENFSNRTPGRIYELNIRGVKCWRAEWYDKATGVRKTKQYAAPKHGYDRARTLCIQALIDADCVPPNLMAEAAAMVRKNSSTASTLQSHST